MVATASGSSSPHANGNSTDGPCHTPRRSPFVRVPSSSGALLPASSSKDMQPLYDDSSLDREEFIRLTLQTLQEAGLTKTAANLEEESGVALETPAVTRFREGILKGDWDTVSELLDGSVIDLGSGAVHVRFLICQQRFLEYLECGDSRRALNVLRKELSPLNHDPERVHALSSFMMCANSEEVRSKAGWDGASGNSRQQLLQQLQTSISPSVMIPRRRMETLLEQARGYQRIYCRHHTMNPLGSLLTDHRCDPSYFPSLETHVLQEHKDEVWVVAFSPSGKYLASGSKDRTAVIWKTNAFSVHKTLYEHEDGIHCIAWSPDETYVCTSAENIIKVWDVETGRSLCTLDKHDYAVGALAWLRDSSGFVSMGMDTRIFVWSANGDIITSTKTGSTRVVHAAMTPDEKRLVIVGIVIGTTEQKPVQTDQTSGFRQILVWDMDRKCIESVVPISRELTGVSISHDSRYALINQSPDEVTLWDLSYSPPRNVRTYHGQQQLRHIIGNTFGGPEESLIISGSEDSNIYIWNRENSVLVDTLSGHSWGSVNSVSWNSGRTTMMASGGDDKTIRVWEGPKNHLT